MDGIDQRSLPLTPIEGFVLSRVDGNATLQDLSDLTNLDPDEVDRVVAKLIEVGAVEWADGSISLPRASMRPSQPEPFGRRPISTPGTPVDRRRVFESEPPQAMREPIVALPKPPKKPSSPYLERVESSDTVQGRRPDNALGSAGAVARIARGESARPPSPADDIDLPRERRERIDEIFVRLDSIDHYAILGIDQRADMKTIRATYFELSKAFHPDTAFRKNIGAYRGKMESIFKRITEAYEVLGKKKARAEYDEYLAMQGLLREAEEAIAPEPAPPPPPPEPEPEPIPEARPMSEEGKRHARELAQKRLGGVRGSSARSTSGPTVTTHDVVAASSPSRNRDEVLRGLASSLRGAAAHTGGLDAVQRHSLEAKRLENNGDLAGAARELRLAVALAPEREDVKLEQQRVARTLAASLASQYRQQAEYEERHRKWGAAAISWAKVVEGRPEEAEPAHRAAVALVEAKGDLHQAQRLAKLACELDPASAIGHRVLGRVYMAAGLHLNARRELERAATLDPKDEIVKNLLRELKG